VTGWTPRFQENRPVSLMPDRKKAMLLRFGKRLIHGLRLKGQ
jgi:hypothetical protein